MLVGRGAELDRILRLCDVARQGRGGSLIVSGDAGIGKSALLNETARQADGFEVLRVRPLQSESHLPFVGLHDLLFPLLPFLDAIPPSQQAALSAALELGPPAPGDRFAAAAATISLFAAAAEHRPVLCVIDDGHWLDEPSRESLLFAARRLLTDPVVLIIATRDRPWLDDVDIEQLHLTGLDAMNASLLMDESGRRIVDQVRERLITDTAGNPLALVSALASLTDDQLNGLAPIAGTPPFGHDLESMYAQRLHPLPSSTRDALLVVATSNSGNRDEILAAMASLGLEPAALTTAENAGMITADDGRWQFEHPLMRSAAYHSAEPANRRRAHEALARILPVDHLDEIAWHLASAAAAPDEDVAGRLEESARTSRARHGYVSAAQALVASARLSPHSEDAFRRMLAAAAAFRAGGQPGDAAGLLDDALALAGNPVARAEAQLSRGYTMLHFQPTMEVCDMLAEEAERVELVDPGRAAAMLATASVLLVGTSDVPMAIATSTRASELAALDGGPVLLVASIAQASALTLGGRTAEARTLLARVTPLLGSLDPLGDVGLLIDMAAHNLVWLEEWTSARHLLERSIAAARSAGAVSALPHSLSIISELEFRCGRMSQALAAAAESVQISSDTGQTLPEAIGLVSLGRVEVLLGWREEAAAHLSAAADLALELGVDSLLDYVAAFRSLGELGRGHPERALRHGREFTERQRRKGVDYPDVVRGDGDFIESLARTDHPAEAVVGVARLEERAAATGSEWATATAARCQGLLAPRRSFEDAFARAFDHHSGADLVEIARTWLCLGQRRLGSGDLEAAREALENALAAFESLGAKDWIRQAERDLAVLGGPSRERSRTALSDLTPQEVQVALLVADGATNAEAAAALFISPKTVEAHLSRVYRKLDVRSRTELSRRVLPPE